MSLNVMLSHLQGIIRIAHYLQYLAASLLTLPVLQTMPKAELFSPPPDTPSYTPSYCIDTDSLVTLTLTHYHIPVTKNTQTGALKHAHISLDRHSTATSIPPFLPPQNQLCVCIAVLYSLHNSLLWFDSSSPDLLATHTPTLWMCPKYLPIPYAVHFCPLMGDDKGNRVPFGMQPTLFFPVRVLWLSSEHPWTDTPRSFWQRAISGCWVERKEVQPANTSLDRLF